MFASHRLGIEPGHEHLEAGEDPGSGLAHTHLHDIRRDNDGAIGTRRPKRPKAEIIEHVYDIMGVRARSGSGFEAVQRER
jgi:hypothetical protein